MTVLDIPAPALEIVLFGPMQVRLAGEPMPRLRSKQALSLLALLTLRHARPVQREWLAGTLWPDSNSSRAFRNLRVVLSELRSALGDEGARLETPGRHTLVLNLAGAEVDLLAFDAACARKTPDVLEQAVELYCGPLLEGCAEEWVFQERQQREQACLEALQTLIERRKASGDFRGAVGYYRRAARLDAWSDGLRRGWMEALANQGDRNGALQVYRDFVQQLRNLPGVMPDEETKALYDRLRAEVRQQPGTSAAPVVASKVASARGTATKVTGYLPHALTDMVGRMEERMEVASHLRRSRLMTLTGVGGIGKTRLALEVASEVVYEYPDGVWLVALESLSESQMVVRQIASVLGVRGTTGQPLLQSVTEFLSGKHLLLVLDNCEHLLQASAEVAAYLLRECEGVRILTTSRETLGIVGETAWAVPALTTPEPGESPTGGSWLPGLWKFESTRLFVERAQAVQKTFALTERNASEVARICSRLEGIPLAIELAAVRVKALTVQQIAGRLDNELGLLTGGSRAAESRQQTLRATLDWSYNLLSAPERSLLKRLSVFAGGCLLDTAEKVCAGEGVETDQVLDLLTSLVDKSLILFEEQESADGRYRLLEMVRQYAAEGLQASGEAEQVKTRHRDWFLALAEEAEPLLHGADQTRWLRRLEAEHDNLRTALAGCGSAPKGSLAGLRLSGALYQFWAMRSDFYEGRAFLETELGREGAQDATVARAKALNGAGALAYRQYDHLSARAHNEAGLTIQRALGDKNGMAVSFNNLGSVAVSQSDYVLARTLYEEGLAMGREMGNKGSIANSLIGLGGVGIHLRDFDTAWTLLEESQAIRREMGDKAGIAISLYYLGYITYSQGDYNSARTLLEESRVLFRETGHSHIIHVIGIMGHVERDAGDYARAGAFYRESLLLRQERSELLGIACSLEDFAGLAGRQGQFARAVRLLGAAEKLCAALGCVQPVALADEYERTVAASRDALSEEAFAAAWEQGRAMTTEQAIFYAT